MISQHLWAKTGSANTTHHLLAHLIDVGAVAEQMLPLMGQRITRLADVTPGTMGFLAALHDIGKISPTFQAKYQPAVQSLIADGFVFPAFYENGPYHQIISAITLPNLLTSLGVNNQVATRVAWALGGHHGLWPTAREMVGPPRPIVGSAMWDSQRTEAVQILFDLFRPDLDSLPDDNIWLTLFTGFVSVVDWIGSDNTRFSFSNCADPAVYIQRARSQAKLNANVWGGTAPQNRQFDEIFGFAMNDTQRGVENVLNGCVSPWCMIIDAATGSGKTEAAFWASREAAGLYVAMPTMATANAMLPRGQRFVDAVYSDGKRVRLAHSQARWMTVRDWFTSNKRVLLQPYGVGTVDQVLMSVLNARHWPVRLLGLANKTVIFDEVHAYDLFMSTIHTRLLEWLRAVDSNVVMLSATLPAPTRRILSVPYGDNTVVVQPTAQSRRVDLNWLDQIPLPAPSTGITGIVMNSVDDCQRIAQTLQVHLSDDELLVLHSRMTRAMRDVAERRLLALAGKGGDRPKRLVVVATQIIEQSLDIDLDHLYTSPAPIDSLIQRIGRLHRHRQRGTPVVNIVDFADDAYQKYDSIIYSRFVLLRTQRALAGRQNLMLPADTQVLLDFVYDSDQQTYTTDEQRAWQRFIQQQKEMEAAAERFLVRAPAEKRLLTRTTAQATGDAEDDEDMLRAVTRLARPSIRLVLVPDGQWSTEENQEWSKLARWVVSVSKGAFVKYMQNDIEVKWKTGPLAQHYAIQMSSDGTARIGDWRLTLDPDLGLFIES